MPQEGRLFIGGAWTAGQSDTLIDVVSPIDGSVIGSVPDATPVDMVSAVAAARQAFDKGPWPHLTPQERAGYMARVGELIGERADELANLITSENGSPLLFSHFAQVGAAKLVLDYFTGLATSYPFEDLRPGMLGPALVRREPVGVCAGIIPWNVPLFISMLKLAPAMAAGATLVLKPSPETALDGLVLAEIIAEAGIPPGVVNIVPGGREAGEALVTADGVDKVSFTGSTLAGRRVGALCGQLLRRCTLELGGKSAAIILDDADLDTTVPQLMPAAVMNNGQACVAQTRVLAPRSRYAEVLDAVSEAAAGLAVGDPRSLETDIGPLVSERQRERVEGYIQTGLDEGAKVTAGGGRPDGLDAGCYVEPTVFGGVTNDMRIAREEIFGPVICVIAYSDVDDAVAIANDSDYGLSGTVWTEDVGRGIDVARAVRTGTYTVNGFALEWSAPFGGFKNSGVGRELGPEGLEAYLEFKTINLPEGTQL